MIIFLQFRQLLRENSTVNFIKDMNRNFIISMNLTRCDALKLKSFTLMRISNFIIDMRHGET